MKCLVQFVEFVQFNPPLAAAGLTYGKSILDSNNVETISTY